MSLKRLWDITNKKMVFVKGPTGHDCQLWVDEATEKMYYYDMSQWIEYTQSAAADGRTYGPTWKVVDSDDEMGVYDTNEPTDLFVWESGDKVSYVFKDWNGTVLKEGKVAEGTKPTAPADPTREATAQYTYTFAGWNPEVAKITKKTTYTATYTATVNNYTVTIAVDPVAGGSVSSNSVTVPYGTAISAEDNVLTIGEGTSATEVTATAETGYVFSSWGEVPATVTGNTSITATFVEDPNFAIIRSDLLSLNPATLGATIALGEDFTETINGRTYEFVPTSENAADVIVVIDGVTYGASVSVETDTIVVGEITVVPEEDSEL